MGSGWLPHISSPVHFDYKIWWYFWSERSADPFKYPQGKFLIFFRKIWSFVRSKNFHPNEAHHFDGSSLKNCKKKYAQKYAQLCAILKKKYKICTNMRKCAQHISPCMVFGPFMSFLTILPLPCQAITKIASPEKSHPKVLTCFIPDIPFHSVIF